ncbi:AfsR/SARP family transcriptional regulator [Catenulispora subtropica]|uniref:BTAD domain-containing putative transcriptional regulator n=1 Tax=Catenulispora subtropica TaxID=450798 RepID=A0ABP5DPR8_9ACTN
MHHDGLSESIYFGVLGSLECFDSGRPKALRGPAQERMVAYLLLSRGTVAPISRLIEAVWDEDQPDTAAHQVRKMISDLRQRLPGLQDRLSTVGPGYRLTIDESEIDHGRFLAGLRSAREVLGGSGNQMRRAIGHLTTSLALWRGPLLDGQGGILLQSIANTIEERRIAALEQLFDLHITLGDEGPVLAGLREAVSVYPTRETLRGQLMLALYRAGCQVEALEEFHRLRRVLDDSYGVEPGHDLGELYQRILRADPALSASRSPAVLSGIPAPVAEESRIEALNDLVPVNILPYDLHDFTGRTQTLELILSLATHPGSGPRPVVVTGMGGSGKSALVIHAGHQLASRYPDAQLYLDLQGFTPGASPMSVHAALAVLLGALGIPDGSIPADLQTRAALWRSTTQRMRFLLVLDNVADANQVRPLFPNSSHCLVLITSRRLLPDLDGAVPVSLGMFSGAESKELLGRILGPDRVRAEATVAEELAGLCGHLPLAIRLSAARLQRRTHWSLQQLVDKLVERSRALTELAIGDRSVQACLSMSFEVLSAGQQSALLMLAAVPGPEIGEHAVGVVLGVDQSEAEELLETLLDAHLITQHAPDRYSLHDLVRAFAVARAEAHNPGLAEDAMARAMGYYARASEQACALLFPGRAGHPVPMESASASTLRLIDDTAALAWFDTEFRAMAAALALAPPSVAPADVYRLARNLVFYQHMKGLTDGLTEVAEIGLEAARGLPDGRFVRIALANLATAQWSAGRLTESLVPLREALQLAEAVGDEPTQISILNRLNACHERLGEYDYCEKLLARALDLLAENPAPQEEATTRNALGVLHLVRGDTAEAVRQCGLARALGAGVDVGTRINVLNTLAEANLAASDLDVAQDCLTEAADLDTRAGQIQAGTNTLCQLAELSLARGSTADAERYADLAIRRLDKGATLSVHWCLTYSTAARVALAAGDLDRARDCYATAAQAAQQSSYRFEEARALRGLAAVADAVGDRSTADARRASAERILAELGIQPVRRAQSW